MTSTHEPPRRPRARPARRAAILVAAACALPLAGCTPAALISQAVPLTLIAGSAVAAESDRTGKVVRYGRTQEQMDLDRLYARVERAECADVESQFWLGNQLEHNGQVPPTYAEAYKWYRLAENAGHEPAAESRAAIAGLMTDAQIAEGEALAQAWRPQTEGCPETG